MECGIESALGVKLKEREIKMRTILFVCAVVFCLEINASECQNGKCSLRSVPKQTVQTVRNVSKGAIRVVTPPYKGRCVNGKCNVK